MDGKEFNTRNMLTGLDILARCSGLLHKNWRDKKHILNRIGDAFFRPLLFFPFLGPVFLIKFIIGHRRSYM